MTTPQSALPLPSSPTPAAETAKPDLSPATNYLNATRGFASWALTLDHKRIGLMYLVGILISAIAATTLSVILRSEHLSGGQTLMNADSYNQIYTLHGAIMVFLVIIPGIPAALGNIVLPIMLGAKDVAFPRLNLTSFYLWITGAIFFAVVLVTGGLDTGWTFYTPYSTNPAGQSNVIMATMGAFILGFSSIFTGLNFVVTIHRLRPPQMGWFRMPLFLWAIYATGLVQILATPVLGITLLLLAVERGLGIGIFNPDLGGDPVLYQHFFWFYSHPAVYIMILPAFGVQSELIAVHSHRQMFGYKLIALSSVAIALLGFLVWGHHMFTSGQSGVMGTIFSFITFFIAIPSAIKVFNWLSTLYRGAVSLNTCMFYALSFMFIFGIGGLTGLWLSTMATDLHLHDTYFVVAHFHYVMAGTAFAFLGALYHWWPKITGKMFNEGWGITAALLQFIGFNLTFLPQFVMGSLGMPRRYWHYEPQFELYHQLSTIGSYVGAVGLTVSLLNLAFSLLSKRKAVANPWGSPSLEWRTPSPPPTENFTTTPVVTDPYDFTVIQWNESQQEYEVHPHAQAGALGTPVESAHAGSEH